MKITKNGDGTYSVYEKFAKQSFAERDRKQPFKNFFTQTEYSATLSEKEDITPPAKVAYKKRRGGVYIFCNNPEMLNEKDVGVPLLRNKNLTGDVFFTYEHSNHSGNPFFLGYKLTNEGDKPVTIDVYNIGNQVRGEWLGQREWCDFYSERFELPEDYFMPDGKTVNPVFVGCDYIDYTPQVYNGEHFVVPPKGYVWVIGGTSGDLPYGSASGKTADMPIFNGKCANGVVYFGIKGGTVTGTFWCYTSPEQCDESKSEQGYIVTRDGRDYSPQYKGIDYDCTGVIDADIGWVIGDTTKKGKLPVTYTVRRDPDYESKTEPYCQYDMKEYTINSDSWTVALNPNKTHEAIGADMTVFNCITTDGKEVCIDTEHNDGKGNMTNIGNWMVQYTTNYSFVNSGKRTRHIKLYSRNVGMLSVMVRDECGRILKKHFIIQPYNFDSLDNVFDAAKPYKDMLIEKNGKWWFPIDGKPFCDVWDERSLAYEIDIPAESSVRFSVDEVILANSCGSIRRWCEID